MNKTFLALSILMFQATGIFCQEQMSVEKFNQIASASGDNTPLVGKLATFPFWTKEEVSIFVNYESGTTSKEDVIQTAKTINGKYIVFTNQIQFIKQSMTSIVIYDEKTSAFKILAVSGNTIVQRTVVLDDGKKTYKISSSFDDGLTETGDGSYSDKQIYEKTCCYKNGVLFMTREVKSMPIEK
jgi:hypothetical protein